MVPQNQSLLEQEELHWKVSQKLRMIVQMSNLCSLVRPVYCQKPAVNIQLLVCVYIVAPTAISLQHAWCSQKAMQANNGINTGRQNFQKLNPAKAHGSCKNLSLYPDSGAEQDVIYQSLAATHTTLTLYSGHAEHFFFLFYSPRNQPRCTLSGRRTT